MQTIGIVLNVGTDQTDAFERGFKEMEAPIWADLHARGVLVMATLTKLDISTKSVDGATHHDGDPRFEAWNRQADAYQVAEPFVFGGDTIVSEGP